MKSKLSDILRLLTLASVGMLIQGCGTPHIKVCSTPPGALVMLDDQSLGKTTPAELLIKELPFGPHRLSVKKDGFEDPEPRILTVEDKRAALACLFFLAAPIVIGQAIDTHGRAVCLDGKENISIKVETVVDFLLREKLPQLKTDAHSPPAEVQKENSSSEDIAARLRKLKELKDAGILNEQEYETKRKTLLNKL